jgi:hypothetical protein
MRREWIEEEKPKVRTDDVEQILQVNPSTLPAATTTGNHVAVDTHLIPTDIDHEKIDRMQSPRRSGTPAQQSFMSDARHEINEDVREDGDELEHLLSEQENEDTTKKLPSTLSQLKPPVNGFGDDEFEAMEELGILNWT